MKKVFVITTCVCYSEGKLFVAPKDKQTGKYTNIYDNPKYAAQFDEKWEAIDAIKEIGDTRFQNSHYNGYFFIEEMFVMNTSKQ